jgi:hypothetical protein
MFIWCVGGKICWFISSPDRCNTATAELFPPRVRQDEPLGAKTSMKKAEGSAFTSPSGNSARFAHADAGAELHLYV